MITFFVTTGYEFASRSILREWRPDMAAHLRVLTYDDALANPIFEAGTYVFADLERLTSTGIEVASEMYEQLKRAGNHVLNNPAHVLRRYDLQRKLVDSGWNDFTTYRVAELDDNVRFPVFVRSESNHDALSDRLYDRNTLDEQILKLVMRGFEMSDLLITEFMDVSDDEGMFWKQSAFVIDGVSVPCSLDRENKWEVKFLDQESDPVVVEAEKDYLAKNPHDEWLREVFALANIDYGRMDYSMLGDRPQIWEINTNPDIMARVERFHTNRMPSQHKFAGLWCDQIMALSERSNSAESVSIRIDDELLHKFEEARRERNRILARRERKRRIKRHPVIMMVRRVLSPVIRKLAPRLVRRVRGRAAN